MNILTKATVFHLHAHGAPFDTYHELFTVLGDITPVVQALPPDSALLQLAGAIRHFGQSPAQLADLLQTRLAARYGLLTSGGIGPNPMLATMAAGITTPGTVTVLSDDPVEQTGFLWNRPVRELPGIGPALERSLAKYGIERVGDLADLPMTTVQRIAGASTGRLIHERANGTDRRTVTPAGPPATITSSHRFDHDVLDHDQIRRALLAAATDLGTRLRAAGQTTRTVELQVTYADRSASTRSRNLREPTAHTPAIRDALYSAFASLGLQRARIRAVTARTGNLAATTGAAVQLTFDRPTENQRALEPVIDRARARFGVGAVQPASSAGTNPNRSQNGTKRKEAVS